MAAIWKSRGITRRMIVEGTLRLLTPAHLGNGDAEGLTDMPLSRDALSGKPLLSGTSIAGALRGYLTTLTHGYRQAEQGDAIAALFGGSKGNDDGDQSPLIVEDAIADSTESEVRDGVAINAKTGTAAEKKKYDLELLPEGTAFPLRFELLIGETSDAAKLCGLLALALRGLEQGEIAIGARRTRGFGRCRLECCRAITYDLTQTEDLLAWLTMDRDWATKPQWRKGNVTALLGNPSNIADKRERFSLTARFSLESGLLIRSDEPWTEHANHNPDAIHLRSRRDGSEQSVLPGTSLAGALRARALRILHTLNPPGLDAQIEPTILTNLFGAEMYASKLLVEERVIEGGAMLAQSRVAIDRFTGGAYDTALFSEAPVFGGGVELQLTIINPKPYEIGLLLLLLKDLWTSDLPLGGASSVGRGRLRGVSAEMNHKDVRWTITEGSPLRVEGDTAKLESYVAALLKETGVA